MASSRSSAAILSSVLAISAAAWTALSLGGLTALLVVLGAAILVAPFSPEVVTLLGVSALYLNLPGIAVIVHGLPPAVAASTWLLLLVPFVVLILLRRQPVLVDAPMLLVVAFLGAVLLSYFSVKDQGAAQRWLTAFLTEGLLMYFLCLNLFRTPESLRRAIIVMMLCGATLGGLTLYQEMSHSYTQQFAGLAQRNIEYGTGEEVFQPKERFRTPTKIHLRERSSGPIGDPNRYAQTLIVLLPLVYFTMRAYRSFVPKIVHAVAAVLILAGALLSYSRGAFIGVMSQIILLKSMGAIRFRTLGILVVVVALAVMAWAPGYVLRLQTLRGVSQVVQRTEPSGGEDPDAVIGGRITEMLAAFNVFLDHPVLGVGPGQFLPIYSTAYMGNPDIALRRITQVRRAHTLYFELAAETGLLGLVTFFGAVGLIQVRLWRAWRRWRRRGRPDLSGLAAGFFLALVGYLVTGLFLHLAYQRYYWLLLGLAGAALQVLAVEDWRFVSGDGSAGNGKGPHSSGLPRHPVARALEAGARVEDEEQSLQPGEPQPATS